MTAYSTTSDDTSLSREQADFSKFKLERSWRHRCPVALRYLIALVLAGLAWVTTFGLRHLIDAPSFQTPFFVCAIVLSSWIGGAGPGIVATIFSIFAIEFSFTEPRYTLTFTFSEVPKFTVFFLAGAFISLLARRQRRDEEALLVARESLEEKVRDRTTDLERANRKLTEEVAERTRAERSLQRLNRAWRVRGLFNRSIARSADEPELVARVCQTLVKSSGYRLAWVAEVDQNRVVAAAHAADDRFERVAEAWAADGPGYPMATRVIESGLAFSWAQRDRKREEPGDPWSESNEVKAVLALPLISDDAILGALLLYSGDGDAFDKQETDLLQQAANDVAQGILLFRARAARASAETALKKTRAELERVSRVTTMGELTASIAHEINQPLAALVTNANACLRWLDRNPPEMDEAREAARRIIRDGKRGSDVLARIRAMLKKQDPIREDLAINEVIDEILALARTGLDGVRLVKDYSARLPLVHGDRVQLQQVILNLVLNSLDAMKVTPDRAPALSISTGVTVGGDIEVAICDNGIGLTEEQVEKIFTTFFTTKTEGLGMGLSICRSIIEQHGGRLWAVPNGDTGVTFRFTLPVALL
ncbi:hypothetical protein TSACC_21465 [Terrimicrobium sacchariphilum]|uniref:histidine kinase n=1 Tax=Terrimicrobium sacchariphilum TaxID=690879 RepID=A0A146G645_TERSA|nr:ATP-binding protein [Terrimicrobium sacchariphilum]GAT33060.1 hypothetical protein TSACC_21465 [Terrimicrobium sacchariphilum]